MMTRAVSPPPSALEVVSLPSAPGAGHRPHTPRSALAATYSTYVVRVHTRHGIKTISFDVLAAFFTYTAKKAAEDLGISSRTLIRVCRSLGIRRWPYLGFRSEKNVERIRQEAIENLRRKLERESNEAAASPSSTHHASASCLRGASAKRLLQVKVPAQAAVPMARGFERPSVFAHDQPPHQYHYQSPPYSPSADEVAYYQEQQMQQMHQQQQQMHMQMQYHALPSLLTPPPTHRAFDLSPRRLPRSLHHPMASSFDSPASSPTSSTASSPSSVRVANMPALNVLLEASMLTAFKHEVESHLATDAGDEDEQQQLHARTMSMRDILNVA